MHTAIGSLRLRSRGAHCEGILAVEVQGCTLRSGAGQTRSAKQIGDEDWRGRKQGGRRKEGGGGGGGGGTTVIKSNNPLRQVGNLEQETLKRRESKTVHELLFLTLGKVIT